MDVIGFLILYRRVKLFQPLENESYVEFEGGVTEEA
jgi:hypothetical protein